MNAKQLSCEGITVGRSTDQGPRPNILDEVSGAFYGGEIALITGDTGAGKTTLLHVMACLKRPTGGQVVFDGKAVSRWTAAHRDRWRRRVGLVFQTGIFLEDLSALENVMVPLVPMSLPRSEALARCRLILEQLDLVSFTDTPVHRLSVGERQRVSMARALAATPSVILADEPTAHQDDGQTARMMAVLADHAREHHSVVVMTAHDHRVGKHPAVKSVYRLIDGRLERRE